MRSRIAWTLLASLAAAACADAGADNRTYDFSAFEQSIQGFLDQNPELAGAGAILVDRHQGVIYKKSFGAFSDDRIYLLASASKMIAAGVLMNLADQGLLDVDRPVADVADWGSGNPSITPAQLVSNSSGLVGLLPNPVYAPYVCQYVFSGSLQDCARQIFTTPDDDADVIPPDTDFRYGGAQWQVAGAVAEVASGKSWAELIREIYVEPCELETLGFNNHFIQLSASESGNPFSYPAGFDSNPGNLEPTDNPNMEGGAYASIGDYGKLLQMHLRGGLCGDHRVLSEAAVRRLHEDRIAGYGGETGSPFEGYGMGWWVDRNTPGLTSDPGAYGAFPWIDEERGYAGFFALEATSTIGSLLWAQTVEHAAAAIDAAR